MSAENLARGNKLEADNQRVREAAIKKEEKLNAEIKHKENEIKDLKT